MMPRTRHFVAFWVAAVAWFVTGTGALAQEAPPGSIAPSYTLGALDQIEVNVANFPELTTRTRINEDNSVTLALIGRIVVGGLTSDAAAREIAGRYKAGGYINDPSIRIEVTEYQSRKVSVLGQVNSQGLIALDRQYTVAELLARAGGLNADAADQAYLVHPTAGGGADRVAIDLAQIGSGGGQASTLVRPGDMLFVPKAVTFSVIGAVNKPGVYRLTTGMTVQEALATAGDIARIGTRSGVRVRRKVDGGAMQLLHVKRDDPVLAGDVVLVRERVF